MLAIAFPDGGAIACFLLSVFMVAILAANVNLWLPKSGNLYGTMLCLAYKLETIVLEEVLMNKEEKAERRLSLRVTQAVKDAFVKKSAESGKSESQALMMLVQEFIGGEVEPRSNIDERFRRIEEEIAALKQTRLGELIASETKIAS